MCLFCGQNLKIRDQWMQQIKQARNPSQYCVQNSKMLMQKLEFSTQFKKFHIFYIHI